MTTTPRGRSNATWDPPLPAPTAHTLRDLYLRASTGDHAADQPLARALHALQDAGWSYATLATAIGTHRSTAHRIATHWTPGPHPIDPVPHRPDRPPKPKPPRDTSHPLLTPDTIAHLTDLWTTARHCHRNTPPDHPARLASHHLNHHLHDLTTHGVIPYRIARALGARPVTIYRRLGRITGKPSIGTGPAGSAHHPFACGSGGRAA